MPRSAFAARAGPTLLLCLLLAGAPASSPAQLPSPPPRVTVIADSVLTAIMWNETPQLELMDGFDMQFQVGVCRRLTEPGCPFEGARVSSLVDVARSLGSNLGQTVVVEVGYNEPPDTFGAAVEQSIVVLEQAGVTRILWVNLHEWQPQYAGMNATLAAVAQKHPDVTIVDWASASRNRYSWFQGDGVHLVYEGAMAMAGLIHDALVQSFDPPLAISAATLPPAVVGEAYNAELGASGGTPPYRWRLVGAPPRGVHLIPDGRLLGAPSVAGTKTFTATVTDTLGVTASARQQIVVQAAPDDEAGSGARRPSGERGRAATRQRTR